MAPRSSPECPTAASCTKLNDDESANEAIPSKFQVWKLASRPHTLTASIVPVIVGHALTLQLIHRHPDWQFDQHPSADTPTSSCPASFDNSPDARQAALLPLSLQFSLFASLVQISTNLHNDYADFVRGADTAARVGHARATQKGWLTPSETMRGCCLALFAAGFVGAWCLVPAGCSAGWDPIGAAVVASSLFNAVAYTGGPFPLGCIGLGGVSIGYSGLGDLFVFLYFGLVATLGVPYLFLTRVACVSTTERLLRLLHPSLLRALPVGFLAVAIIVVNNLRDRHTDVHAGKKTMAVRFGKRFCQVEYFVLLVGSYAFCMWFWWSSSQMSDGWTELLPLLSLPMAIPQLKAVAFGEKDGSDLNAHVGGTAKVQMFYCILMAIGLRISITSSCNHQPMI
ncbi:hypothetical protein ACHAXS_005082 [Conticribra weissflogii]